MQSLFQSKLIPDNEQHTHCLQTLTPLTSDAIAAETIQTTGQSYEAELKKAIQTRTQRESLFEGFFQDKVNLTAMFSARAAIQSNKKRQKSLIIWSSRMKLGDICS